MLKGKSAIVTGSTSGIGIGIATALAEQGADVLLNGFGDGDRIDTLRHRLEQQHRVRVRYSAADMSRPDAIRAMVDYARGEFGKIDIIVNNAGIGYSVEPAVSMQDVLGTSEEDWNTVININLTSVFLTSRYGIPEMLKSGGGSIVNVASAHGLTASPFKSAYVAAKHGMVGLSRAVALEVAEHGVTCNTVCPGYVKTPLVEQQIADQARAHGISPENVVRDVMLVHQARKEFVRVEELAALAVFLCSDAGASMTGTALAMDGGWTLH